MTGATYRRLKPNFVFAGLLLLAGCLWAEGKPAAIFAHGDLKVSENHRFLVHADGMPFFYLGDTAWELFDRLTREEADRYLDDRRQNGFTVIQAVVLAELDGLDTPNAYGHRPLVDDDPTKPNEAYFKHVDYIVNRAREDGLYIGMLPTWGDKVLKKWGKGPVIFNESNARIYGKMIGARYHEAPNIIWILGGDRTPCGYEKVWRAMAEGIREGDGARHLMTYHPSGGSSSSQCLGDESWLDFNMIQSGHDQRDKPNYLMIENDYVRTPVKPVIDGEQRYENHPVNWKPHENGWFDERDVRQAAYWAVFAGAFGDTYGCHDIWQMLAPGREPVGFARGDWYTSLDLPGATQMKYLKNLMLSRPFLTRVPDQSLIAGAVGEGRTHVQATHGNNYLFVYLPTGSPVMIAMGKVSGVEVNAWWYDPRTGAAIPAGKYANTGTREFTPRSAAAWGNDWILVLDDAAAHFQAPGQIFE